MANSFFAANLRIAMAVVDEIEALLIRNSGLTEAEIAAALFGEAGYPARVAGACMTLLKRRRIERSGRGGRSDPFRYFPKGQLDTASSPVKRQIYFEEQHHR
jgi:hypothetical protein